MIAELFYPKELKKTIADLRAKDDLNEEALRRVNHDIMKKYTVILCIFIVLLTSAFWAEVFSFFSLILGLVLATGSFILNFTNKYTLPYTIGSKVDGYITGVNYEKIPFHGYSGWSIRYEYAVGSEKFEGSSEGIDPTDVKSEELKQGDRITIFYMPNDPSISVPYLPSQYKLFSLNYENY